MKQKVVVIRIYIIVFELKTREIFRQTSPSILEGFMPPKDNVLSQPARYLNLRPDIRRLENYSNAFHFYIGLWRYDYVDVHQTGIHLIMNARMVRYGTSG